MKWVLFVKNRDSFNDPLEAVLLDGSREILRDVGKALYVLCCSVNSCLTDINLNEGNAANFLQFTTDFDTNNQSFVVLKTIHMISDAPSFPQPSLLFCPFANWLRMCLNDMSSLQMRKSWRKMKDPLRK